MPQDKSMDTFICNLPIIDNGNSVHVKTTWSESNMTIAILDDNTAWKGTLPYSQLSQHHHAFNISEKEHRNKCREVLSTDQGVKDFSYHLEKDLFIWKKKILTDMKIKFGQIDIHTVPISDVCKEIMSALIAQNKIFISKVSTYEVELSKLRKDNTELLQTIEEFTYSKLQEEQVLFGKFIALLNTKKQRVACLEKLLFKNLCADTEESKAINKPDIDNNWNSDTDPEELDDSIETSTIAGPSGIRVTTITCEDTDDEDSPVIPSRNKSPSPSSSKSSSVKRSSTPTSHKEVYTLSSKIPKLDPEKNKSPEKTISAPSDKGQKFVKPVSEMDSQELLDLL